MNKKNYLFNKWVAYTAVLITLYVINSTVIESFKIFSIKPNLIIPLVVCIALFENYITGAVFGFFAGFFCDALGSKSIGPQTFSLMLCGFAVGYLCNVVLQKSLTNAIWLSVLVSIINNLAIYFYYYFIFDAREIFIAVFKIIIPEAIYTIVFTAVLYFLIDKINRVLKETQ